MTNEHEINSWCLRFVNHNASIKSEKGGGGGGTETYRG